MLISVQGKDERSWSLALDDREASDNESRWNLEKGFRGDIKLDSRGEPFSVSSPVVLSPKCLSLEALPYPLFAYRS